MQKTEQKNKLILPGIDYTPAVLSKGTNDDWRIVFYAFNPVTKKLERIRKRVKKLTPQKTRLQFANAIIHEINRKLSEGWNPFIEQENVYAFNLFTDTLTSFLNRVEKMLDDKSMRPDTHRAYKSYCRNLTRYLEEKKLTGMFVVAYNKKFVVNFLDWIYYERKNSPTTHNNHLQFLKTFGNYLLDREFIKVNPADSVTKIKELDKKRIIVPDYIRDQISIYLKETNKPYLVLCLMTFYCFIRRTELTKIKVNDIDFKKNTVFIDGAISKSRKDDFVTLPEDYKKMLVEHTKNAKPDMYLFSANGFKPGFKQLSPKKISDTWGSLRKILKLDARYQFYSLKDTGITEMLEDGTPSLSVKHQARHSDITITEKYVHKRTTTDENILHTKIKF